MLSYSGLRSLFSSIFYNSIWVHTGIIYVDEHTSEIYVFEAANYFPPYVGEVVRVPILKWMKINRNARAIALLPINNEIPYNDFQNVFNKYEKVKMSVESLGRTWARFLKTKRICDLPENHIFSKKFNCDNIDKDQVFNITCHELTIAALQEAGVIEHNITPCSFFPSNVYNRKFKCINGYSYCEPLQISFHQYIGELSNSINY